MPKIAYKDKNFSPSTLAVIDQANSIIDEYQTDGLKLTLRQLYYQFVSRALIANKQSEYKRLGSIISDARLAGLVDWEAIEDRTRNLKRNSHWNDPGDIMQSVVSSFKLDHWENQQYRVEVWIEKEALVGVIATICDKLDVPYFACKGYVSASEMWNASQRFQYVYGDQKPIVIHLGDHDPSGIDMTRDIDDRQNIFDGGAVMNRIALNFDQVEKYNPPPNPAKLSDSRASGYIAKYGAYSWELDALEPRTMRDLISDTIAQYRDSEIYQQRLDLENEYKRVLHKVEENWKEL
jgi:hypothetical protein